MMQPMRIFPRLLLVLAMAWLGVVFFQEARAAAAAETPDPTKVILMFGAVVLVAVAVGVFVALSILPAIGDSIGHFFFNPNEEIEKDPHSAALARVARGDYMEAIEEYNKVFAKNPHDTHALSEMVHLYCDKLHDYADAADLLEQALQRDWPPEEGAFLAERLVDVYWNYQRDAIRARELLVRIAESMPDTKHAANALHRLREIDRAVESGELDADASVAVDTESAVPPADSRA